MPDISKCSNSNCKMKNKCYRFKAISNEYQSYSFFEPDLKTKKCNFFLEMLTTQKEKNLDKKKK